jgi:hypothetical protein
MTRAQAGEEKEEIARSLAGLETGEPTALGAKLKRPRRQTKGKTYREPESDSKSEFESSDPDSDSDQSLDSENETSEDGNQISSQSPGEGLYKVDAILNSFKGADKSFQHLVKYKRFDAPSWQPLSNVVDCTDIIRKFHARYRNKPKPSAYDITKARKQLRQQDLSVEQEESVRKPTLTRRSTSEDKRLNSKLEVPQTRSQKRKHQEEEVEESVRRSTRKRRAVGHAN